MYCNYPDREELEDDLYGEEDSDGSEVNSEVEFHLYSQLHYASDTRLVNGEDLENEEQQESKNSADSEQGKTLRGKDGLQERHALKQHRLKVDNHKKADAKSSRPPATSDEVIVIDSGTDFANSEDDDDDDDDEGVCTLKGGKLKSGPLQSSSPVAQTREKRKRSPSLDSVVLVNCGSEPDTSESESESDDNSDVLESWMILGQGKEVEDHSISLNLAGQSGSGTDCDEAENGHWLVSSKDRTAQIYNREKSRGVRPLARRDSNRYYQDKNITCRNCNKNGHLSKTCPSPMKVSSCMLCGAPGHMGTCCPNRHCNNCGLPGHLYEACSEKAYWFKKCHRCGMTGHFFDVCPEIWRQYHVTTRTGPPQPARGEDLGRTPAYCYNCSRKGHFGHACSQRRMFNGTYPSTPFINYYDTHGDFKQRDHRMKWKVKELQEAGLLTATAEAPATPGPPKKKQRTACPDNGKNRDKNPNRRETAGARPSPPSVRAPVPGHIRFDQRERTKSAGPAVVFKTKLSRALKPQPAAAAGTTTTTTTAAAAAKQWKPKREVPATKAPPPKAKAAPPAAKAPPPAAAQRKWPPYEEDADFPRGGQREGRPARKNNRNGSRKNLSRRSKAAAPSDPRPAPFRRESYTPEQLFGSGAGGKAKKARWKRKRQAKGGAGAYPTDENLFTIKQRNRRK